MCASYERCLDKAVTRNWRGFSCRNCRTFKPLQFDSNEWFLDSLACFALIAVAEHQSDFKQKRRGRIVSKMLSRHSRNSILNLS